MSADPKKVAAILQAGRSETTEEVKSFLQACQYNAKFTFESEQAYAQVTKPLRELLSKKKKFLWSQAYDDAYHEITSIMTSDSALRHFDPSKKTVMVIDAGPQGIEASIYQENDSSTWVPIDHASRSLTPCEQRYHQIERESLAVALGMNIHRYHLLGIYFYCYTDHQPLIPIYTRGGKKGPAIAERHRLSAQDFHFTIKYMPGKSNPCDYHSRHPLPHEQARGTDTLLDYDDELFISRIISNDLPDAVTLPMVERFTATDPTMKKLISCIKQGYISKDPDLQPYKQVFRELTFTQAFIIRGERSVIPTKELAPGEGNLQQLAVNLACVGHQGEVKYKRLLRSKLGSPT